MPSGERTFVLLARFQHGADPTRRALGAYPAVSLAEAREKASKWRELIKRGSDPAQERSGNEPRNYGSKKRRSRRSPRTSFGKSCRTRARVEKLNATFGAYSFQFGASDQLLT